MPDRSLETSLNILNAVKESMYDACMHSCRMYNTSELCNYAQSGKCTCRCALHGLLATCVRYLRALAELIEAPDPERRNMRIQTEAVVS
jgi:hypothetical protein